MTEVQRAEVRARIARGEPLRATARALGIPESSVLGQAHRDRVAAHRPPAAARVARPTWEHRLVERWADRRRA